MSRQQSIIGFTSGRQPLAEVAENAPRKRPRGPPLDDDEILGLLADASKARQIAAELEDGEQKRSLEKVLDHLHARLRSFVGADASDPPPAPATWSFGTPFAAFSFSLVANASKVSTRTYVFEQIWPRWEALHKAHPTHPLFGACEVGIVRAPFRLPGGTGAATSWHKRMKDFAGSVARSMGETILPGSCWIIKDQDASIQRRRPDKTQERLASYKHHRLLAFISNPTPAAWGDFLLGEQKPGLHFCHNGFGSSGSGCANGIQHVLFGSAAENNVQRDCASRDASKCPGHLGGVRCVYVHRGGNVRGQIKPCLNDPARRPSVCPHSPACF